MKYILMAILTLSLTGCFESEEENTEKLISDCWKKYEHDEEGILKDPKCSNLTVIERFSVVNSNRACAYPDLYNGEYNLNDLSNLSAKEQTYTKNVLVCTDKYRKYADLDPRLPKIYDKKSITKVIAALEQDKNCDNPAVRARLEKVLSFGPAYDPNKKCKK